jgi:hypothetical protein
MRLAQNGVDFGTGQLPGSNSCNTGLLRVFYATGLACIKILVTVNSAIRILQINNYCKQRESTRLKCLHGITLPG